MKIKHIPMLNRNNLLILQFYSQPATSSFPTFVLEKYFDEEQRKKYKINLTSRFGENSRGFICQLDFRVGKFHFILFGFVFVYSPNTAKCFSREQRVNYFFFSGLHLIFYQHRVSLLLLMLL